jgi:D-3-phosphoglycerate dehydrogenase
MSRYKVVMTAQLFPSADIEREMLASIGATLEVADGSKEDVLRRSREADALLTHYFRIDAGVISELAACRVIARYGIGVDSIDLRAARDRGIVVTNVPDFCVEEVAVHSLALLLGLLRKVVAGDAYVRAGHWSVGGLAPIRRLSTLTVGQIGYGRIARHLAATLVQLGCTLLTYDPYLPEPPAGTRQVGLEQLLCESDAVLIHAPLTPETSGLIGARELGLMPAHAVLVNTSRGGLVDLDALLGALRAGAIAGAALDVFDQEPVHPGRLAGVPNLIVSPHIGYYSAEATIESQRKATTQVLKVLRGEAPDYPVLPPPG